MRRCLDPRAFQITFGDQNSSEIYSKKIARKTVARKASDPRSTLEPQWNIIENGTITKYTLHTKTLDTRNCPVKRENDLEIVTHLQPSHQKQVSPPKRLIHMVACKSLRECNRNPEKIKEFCSIEKTRA